jgi:DNA-binding CsgD family transcriptional regulator
MADRPRSTRSAGRRIDVEVLRRRVAFLEGDDRVLATAVLEYGLSVAAVARLTARSRSGLTRRLGRIVRRLADDTYSRCSTPTAAFSPAELEILRAHFLQGKSAKEITRQRAVSYYRVLRTIRRARAAGQGGMARPMRF